MATIVAPQADVRRDTQFNLSVSARPWSDVWDIGQSLEADVFIKKGYVKDANELAVEYRKYMETSEFALVERGEEALGSARMIFYARGIGFKTFNDITRKRLTVDRKGYKLMDGLNLDRTMEIGTLGADERARSRPEDAGRVAMALYGIVYRESITHGCDYGLASFDEEYAQRFSGIFGPGVKPLGPAKHYMGSPTIPVLMDLNQMYDHLSNMPGAQDAVNGFANSVVHD